MAATALQKGKASRWSAGELKGYSAFEYSEPKDPKDLRVLVRVQCGRSTLKTRTQPPLSDLAYLPTPLALAQVEQPHVVARELVLLEAGVDGKALDADA